jgi:sortase A
VIVAQIVSFLHGSSVHGAAAIRQERRAIAAGPAACRGSVTRGLLEAPALGLVAPVKEGTSDAVLEGAVGHVTGSAWPGVAGTAVFAAHDVTWFARIGRLKPGDAIRYVTPCHTYSYLVTAHHVVHTGYQIYNTPIPSMILDTCYPLNAFYPTSARYLVYATLASSSPAPRAGRGKTGPSQLSLLVPPALAAQGLSLDQNRVPLGIIRYTGSPSPAWLLAGAPHAAAAVLAAYFGVIRSAEQNRQDWWAQLAPSVPATAAAGLRGGEIVGYQTSVSITLRVTGDQILGATVSTVVTTLVASGGSVRPGTYYLTVAETVTSRGQLLVSGFAMQPTRR